MPFDLGLPAGPTAFVFPGQGAQQRDMLAPFEGTPDFRDHFSLVCDLLDFNPLEEVASDPERLNANTVSSLMTVLASILCLDELRAKHPDLTPKAVAGYSVGQWAALYAAGALSAESLLRFVHDRAVLMDASVAAHAPSGMLAVMGIKTDAIAQLISELAEEDPGGGGGWVEITNDNAPGQVTLGGSLAGLERIEVRLAALRPKKLARVPVAGAWHSRLLVDAVAPLADRIAALELRPTSVPVVDNTTGKWLPEDPTARTAALAAQVAAPVLWRQGLASLGEVGVEVLVEIGHGDLLTRFGFFALRGARHHAVISSRPSRRPDRSRG